MKRPYSLEILSGALICSGVALLLIAALNVSAASAAELSPETRALILNRIPEAGERNLVLQNASKAVGSGYREDHLVMVVEKSIESGISGKGISRMIDILSAAHGRSMPTRPYTLKILEGLIKRVPENRLIRALERVNERMEFSVGLAEDAGLPGGGSDELIIMTSDAVAAGMDRGELTEVYRTMASNRINREIKPEQIMEMIKAARGYGLESKKVGAFAKDLMTDPDADEQDIRRFLKRLADRTYTGGSGKGSDERVEKPRGSEDPGESGGDDEGDDEGYEDGSDDGGSGDDPSGDDDSEDDGSEGRDSEEGQEHD